MWRVVYDKRRHMASSVRDVASSLLVASRSPTRDSGTEKERKIHFRANRLIFLAICGAAEFIWGAQAKYF